MRQGGPRPTRSDCNFFAEMAGFAAHHRAPAPEAGSERSGQSPTRSLALPSFLQPKQPRPVPAHALHSTASAAPRVQCISLSRAFACGDETPLSSRASSTNFTALPFTCYPACLPCHCWPCEPAAPICSLALVFSSSHSSQNIIPHLLSLATVLVDSTDHSHHDAGCSQQETQA